MASPLLNVVLPQPIVIHPIPLTGLYACMLGIDTIVQRHSTRSCQKSLKMAIIGAHLAIPLIVVSPSSGANVAFTSVPWFLATYRQRLWKNRTTSWFPKCTLDSRVVKEGLWKVGRGVVKLLLLGFCACPLLPQKPDQILQTPYLSWESLANTFLVGSVAYLILGSMDILSGTIQAITGQTVADMFDNPYLATSPRDFWSRRWNRYVRNELHNQVFSPSNRAGKGAQAFMAFLISASFHELIVWCVCRRVTMENFCFFVLHGFVCALEVKYFKLKQPKSKLGIGAARVCQLGFMVLTGRLFLAPYLRHPFDKPLPYTFL
ncbi:hypothetical protein BY458DRAFT_505580 [Sporodiniella umbellata]|nr:hypothetical protein BY458DRAFT_505580 [Sporodiniella umbellata]